MYKKVILVLLIGTVSVAAYAGKYTKDWEDKIRKGDTRLTSTKKPPTWLRGSLEVPVCVSAHLRNGRLFKSWRSCNGSGVTATNLGLYYPSLKLRYHKSSKYCKSHKYRVGEMIVPPMKAGVVTHSLNGWYGPNGPTSKPRAWRCYTK